MTNVNIPNLFNFLLFVSFVYNIKGHCKVKSAYNDKQRKIATKARLQNNSVENPETVITAVITMLGENNVNSELSNLKNLTGINFKFRDKLHSRIPTKIRKRKIFQRQIRNTMNNTSALDDLECMFCFGDGVSIKDENCYRGVSTNTEKCIYGQECYVEVRPQFIKRGCISRSKLNRTFVCKCPLCNDKPSNDLTYYTYNDVKDWEYDNKLLEKPFLGVNLICKVCETKGTNIASDRSCRTGKYVDYMVCGQNQVCYINMDDETNFVSRGCINKRAQNTFYDFCNRTICNSKAFDNPKAPRLQQLAMMPTYEVRSNGSIKNLQIFFIIFCIVMCL